MTDTAIFFGKAFVLCGLITVFVLPKIPPQHRKSYVLATIGVWIFLQLLLFWVSTWFVIHLILDTLIIAAILFYQSKDLRQFAKMMGVCGPRLENDSLGKGSIGKGFPRCLRLLQLWWEWLFLLHIPRLERFYLPSIFYGTRLWQNRSLLPCKSLKLINFVTQKLAGYKPSSIMFNFSSKEV